MLNLMMMLGAALGVAAPDSGQAPQAAPADPDQKIVCRREAVLGSNLQKRVCHTKREWREASARDQETLERSGALDRIRNGPRRPNE